MKGRIHELGRDGDRSINQTKKDENKAPAEDTEQTEPTCELRTGLSVSRTALSVTCNKGLGLRDR